MNCRCLKVISFFPVQPGLLDVGSNGHCKLVTPSFHVRAEDTGHKPPWEVHMHLQNALLGILHQRFFKNLTCHARRWNVKMYNSCFSHQRKPYLRVEANTELFPFREVVPTSFHTAESLTVVWWACSGEWVQDWDIISFYTKLLVIVGFHKCLEIFPNSQSRSKSHIFCKHLEKFSQIPPSSRG